MGWVCRGLLLLNVVWDGVSALSIWMSSCVKDVQDVERERRGTCELVAGMHTSMWALRADEHSHAACMLMAWWVLTLGSMRLLALYREEWMLLAVLSYGLEGCAFFIEGLKATMVPRKACPAALFSLACLVVCVLNP
jgi:hypothetical protein